MVRFNGSMQAVQNMYSAISCVALGIIEEEDLIDLKAQLKKYIKFGSICDCDKKFIEETIKYLDVKLLQCFPPKA